MKYHKSYRLPKTEQISDKLLTTILTYNHDPRQGISNSLESVGEEYPEPENWILSTKRVNLEKKSSGKQEGNHHHFFPQVIEMAENSTEIALSTECDEYHHLLTLLR